MTAYLPLSGVKVLDLGILVPAALTSGKLAALGADVVKVEQPPLGDRIRVVPPFAEDGRSPQHMSQNWGKRSIGIDVLNPEGKAEILALIAAADVVVENQLAGFWKEHGVDFAAIRGERPELVVCSVTGFGQTGPWARLPSHGLNMDALGDTLNVDWRNGQPHRGWTFTSWGNELGATMAAMAVCAALVSVRSGGLGEWIDLSCWDAIVECHRAELALSHKTGQPFSMHDVPTQALYDTYLARDNRPVLLGTLEPKFWRRFCMGIGREDLIDRHGGAALAFGDEDVELRRELERAFAREDSDVWLSRFLEWDVPGGPVYDVGAVMDSAHFAERQIMAGGPGQWPEIGTAIRWQHSGARAGHGLEPPPDFDDHATVVRAEWLDVPTPSE